MNQLKRLWQVVRGRAGDFLDDVEDPEQQLATFVGELDEQIQGLHRSVAAAVADEKRLKMQIEDHLARAADWESRAVLALQDGNEELARQALLEKEQCEARSLALQRGWEAQKAATEKLKASLQAARARVADAKTKYTLLVAQYRSASTKKKIHDSLSVANVDSPMQMMERLSDRIRRLEAEAEVDLELGVPPGDELEAAFVALERKTKGDEALQLLKQKLAERRQLPDRSGATERIEALKAKLDKV